MKARTLSQYQAQECVCLLPLQIVLLLLPLPLLREKRLSAPVNTDLMHPSICEGVSGSIQQAKTELLCEEGMETRCERDATKRETRREQSKCTERETESDGLRSSD